MTSKLKGQVKNFVTTILDNFENDSEIMASMEEYVTGIEECKQNGQERDEVISSLLDRVETLESKMED